MIKCKHCFEWLKLSEAIGKLKFGDKLRILRQQKNMTLKLMSKFSGVQSATLCRMENNKAIGNIKSYMGIARALGLELSDLFTEMEKNNVGF